MNTTTETVQFIIDGGRLIDIPIAKEFDILKEKINNRWKSGYLKSKFG